MFKVISESWEWEMFPWIDHVQLVVWEQFFLARLAYFETNVNWFLSATQVLLYMTKFDIKRMVEKATHDADFDHPRHLKEFLFVLKISCVTGQQQHQSSLPSWQNSPARALLTKLFKDDEYWLNNFCQMLQLMGHQMCCLPSERDLTKCT